MYPNPQPSRSLGDAHLRPAIASEREALEALQRRASLNNPGDREALLANPDAIELPTEQILAGQVFVLERRDVIAGFAVILPREDGDTDLDGLFVEPDCWRQGIGRSLVQHCADIAHSAGSSILHVVGNPHAELFYKSCGFELTGTTATRFGDGLLMRKAL